MVPNTVIGNLYRYPKFFFMLYKMLVLQRAQYFIYLLILGKCREVGVEKRKVYNTMGKIDNLGSLHGDLKVSTFD